MRLIVAIDGPSGVGKSTTARRLAKALGVPYLDTGAMYRAVGYLALRAAADPDDEAGLLELLDRHPIGLERDAGGSVVLLEGARLGDEIRTPEVSAVTSRVSVHSAIRDLMVQLQRSFAERHGGVIEGRDIGSVVFPDAAYKFFLDAEPLVRARRRQEQLAAKGRQVSLPQIEEEISERDARDRSRTNSPLRYDETYTLVDTSAYEPDEVLQLLLEHIGNERPNR